MMESWNHHSFALQVVLGLVFTAALIFGPPWYERRRAQRALDRMHRESVAVAEQNCEEAERLADDQTAHCCAAYELARDEHEAFVRMMASACQGYAASLSPPELATLARIWTEEAIAHYAKRRAEIDARFPRPKNVGWAMRPPRPFELERARAGMRIG